MVALVFFTLYALFIYLLIKLRDKSYYVYASAGMLWFLFGVLGMVIPLMSKRKEINKILAKKEFLSRFAMSWGMFGTLLIILLQDVIFHSGIGEKINEFSPMVQPWLTALSLVGGIGLAASGWALHTKKKWAMNGIMLSTFLLIVLAFIPPFVSYLVTSLFSSLLVFFHGLVVLGSMTTLDLKGVEMYILLSFLPFLSLYINAQLFMVAFKARK